MKRSDIYNSRRKLGSIHYGGASNNVDLTEDNIKKYVDNQNSIDRPLNDRQGYLIPTDISDDISEKMSITSNSDDGKATTKVVSKTDKPPPSKDFYFLPPPPKSSAPQLMNSLDSALANYLEIPNPPLYSPPPSPLPPPPPHEIEPPIPRKMAPKRASNIYIDTLPEIYDNTSTNQYAFLNPLRENNRPSPSKSTSMVSTKAASPRESVSVRSRIDNLSPPNVSASGSQSPPRGRDCTKSPKLDVSNVKMFGVRPTPKIGSIASSVDTNLIKEHMSSGDYTRLVKPSELKEDGRQIKIIQGVSASELKASSPPRSPPPPPHHPHHAPAKSVGGDSKTTSQASKHNLVTKQILEGIHLRKVTDSHPSQSLSLSSSSSTSPPKSSNAHKAHSGTETGKGTGTGGK